MNDNHKTDQNPEKAETLQEEIRTDVQQSLALERTVMANQRTLMSFLRTALAIVGAGLTIQHFSNLVWLTVVGLLLIPAGLVLGILGYFSYRNRKKQIGENKLLLNLRIFGRNRNVN